VEKQARRDEKEYRSSTRLKTEKMSVLGNCDHLFSAIIRFVSEYGQFSELTFRFARKFSRFMQK
jgi:hypothetical protein